VEIADAGNRIWDRGRHHHPRRRRAGADWFGNGNFIRAEGASQAGGLVPGRMERGTLLRQGSALKFVAEVAKVFRADLHLQDFFDHRREVGQGTDCTQGRRACRPYHAPRGGQHERLHRKLDEARGLRASSSDGGFSVA